MTDRATVSQRYCVYSLLYIIFLNKIYTTFCFFERKTLNALPSSPPPKKKWLLNLNEQDCAKESYFPGICAKFQNFPSANRVKTFHRQKYKMFKTIFNIFNNEFEFVLILIMNLYFIFFVLVHVQCSHGHLDTIKIVHSITMFPI